MGRCWRRRGSGRGEALAPRRGGVADVGEGASWPDTPASRASRNPGAPASWRRHVSEAGMSIAQIAEAVGRSKATVRHWLIRHGLKTHGGPGGPRARQVKAAKEAGLATVTMRCSQHGETDFWLNGRGYYRCKRCRSDAVVRRRRKVKAILVAEAGGACCICGFDRNMRALHFHHVEPSLKRHELNAKGVAIALEKLRVEAQKCVLLCSNCHAEVEDGMVSIPADALDRTDARPG